MYAVPADPAIGELSHSVVAAARPVGGSVAFAAPDAPARACPEWRRCDFCARPLEPGNGKPVQCGICGDTGVIDVAAGGPI